MEGPRLIGLYDIAQLFDSPEGAEERVVRALEILRAIVPYDQCALLEARLGSEPHVVVAAPLAPEERRGLTATLVELFVRLVDPESAHPARRPPLGALQLAVPLVGLDRVVGLLLVRRAGGDYEPADVRALSVVAAQLAAYLTMIRARAEAAEQRRELDAARRAAEDARRAKEELVALISHELEAPLRSMVGWVRALGPHAEDAAQRQLAVQALERGVLAQHRLIDELVLRSELTASALRLELRVTEPAALVKATIDGLRLEAERQSIRIDADLEGAAMPLLLDADRIVQALETLIANALRFTPAGGQVVVRLDRQDGFARIRVEDSGSGIRAEQLPHIFDRLHGGAAGRVGLALVKRLVELHHGRVRADSAGVSLGATFTIELPFVKARGTQPLPIAGPLAGVRVLLVDQDPGIGDAFRAALDHHGALVTIASSATAALAALEGGRPDVLLLGDLAMPRDEVFELMREMAVRSSPLSAASITAYDRPEDTHQALRAGFRMLLGKPLGIDALIDLVARLAGRPTVKPAAKSSAKP